MPDGGASVGRGDAGRGASDALRGRTGSASGPELAGAPASGGSGASGGGEASGGRQAGRSAAGGASAPDCGAALREQLGKPQEVLFERREHRRRVQRRGGVEDGEQVQADPVDLRGLRTAVHAGDPRRVAGEQLGGVIAERTDHLRPDELDLPPKIRLAGRDLVRPRVAVVGRPALEHVGDEHLLAREPDGAEQLLEELAGLAHERPALLVLVVAGSLAHEHEVAGWVTLAGHRPGARGVQARTACTPRPPRGGRRAQRGRRQWQVPQEELAQDEQFLVAPLPPRLDDDECTAKVDSSRQTSPE